MIGRLAERERPEFGRELRGLNADCLAELRAEFGGPERDGPDKERVS